MPVECACAVQLFCSKEKHEQKHFIRIIAIYKHSLFIIKNFWNLQSRSAFAHEEERNVLVVLGEVFGGAPASAGFMAGLSGLGGFSSLKYSLILLLLSAFCSTKTCFCLFSLFRLLYPIPLACPAFPSALQCCITWTGEVLGWAPLSLLLMVQMQWCHSTLSELQLALPHLLWCWP